MVVGVQPPGRLRVHPGQLLQHGLAPLLGQLRLQLSPQGAVRGEGGEGAPRQQGVDVQPGAPRHNGQLAPGQDVVHTLGGHVHVPGHGEVLPRVGHIQHVVGDAAHFLPGGLGGADVHAPVDLHGVGGDHLAIVKLGQLHRHAGLSRGGGAYDDNDLRGHRAPPFQENVGIIPAAWAWARWSRHPGRPGTGR